MKIFFIDSFLNKRSVRALVLATGRKFLGTSGRTVELIFRGDTHHIVIIILNINVRLQDYGFHNAKFNSKSLTFVTICWHK